MATNGILKTVLPYIMIRAIALLLLIQFSWAEDKGHWFLVMASAYAGGCPICCGKDDGITSIGVDCKRVPYNIAADPKYLPYGTRIFIPQGNGYLDNARPDDRVFIVDDTGGAIRNKSRHSEFIWIDLRYKTHSSAKDFFPRLMWVYVYE